jgi:hypothetical protein
MGERLNGKYLVWSGDGTQILVEASTDEERFRKVDELGLDLSEAVLEYVPLTEELLSGFKMMPRREGEAPPSAPRSGNE